MRSIQEQKWHFLSWVLAPCSSSLYYSYSLNSLYSFFAQLFLCYADHRRSHSFLSGRSVSRSTEVGDVTPRTLVGYLCGAAWTQDAARVGNLGCLVTRYVPRRHREVRPDEMGSA